MATRTTRCSLEHLLEYKEAINDYLKSKNITDFTKYEVNLRYDKIQFLRWEYPTIDKPVNITPSQRASMKYHPVDWRFIYVNAKTYVNNTRINENGNIISDTSVWGNITLNNPYFQIETQHDWISKSSNSDSFVRNVDMVNGCIKFEVDREKVINPAFTGYVRFLVISDVRAAKANNTNVVRPVMYQFDPTTLNSING